MLVEVCRRSKTSKELLQSRLQEEALRVMQPLKLFLVHLLQLNCPVVLLHQFLIRSLVVVHLGDLDGLVVPKDFFLFTTMKILHTLDVGKDVLVLKLLSAERCVLEENSARSLPFCHRPLEQVSGGWLKDFLDNFI